MKRHVALLALCLLACGCRETSRTVWDEGQTVETVERRIGDEWLAAVTTYYADGLRSVRHVWRTAGERWAVTSRTLWAYDAEGKTLGWRTYYPDPDGLRCVEYGPDGAVRGTTIDRGDRSQTEIVEQIEAEWATRKEGGE